MPTTLTQIFLTSYFGRVSSNWSDYPKNILQFRNRTLNKLHTDMVFYDLNYLDCWYFARTYRTYDTHIIEKLISACVIWMKWWSSHTLYNFVTSLLVIGASCLAVSRENDVIFPSCILYFNLCMCVLIESFQCNMGGQLQNTATPKYCNVEREILGLIPSHIVLNLLHFHSHNSSFWRVSFCCKEFNLILWSAITCLQWFLGSYRYLCV